MGFEVWVSAGMEEVLCGPPTSSTWDPVRLDWKYTKGYKLLGTHAVVQTRVALGRNGVGNLMILQSHSGP